MISFKLKDKATFLHIIYSTFGDYIIHLGKIATVAVQIHFITEPAPLVGYA